MISSQSVPQGRPKVRPPMGSMRMLSVIALISCLVAASDAFSVSGGCFVGSSATILRGSRGGLARIAPLRKAGPGVGAVSMDLDWYKMEKGEDLGGGAAKYKFTVDVEGAIVKNSYNVVIKEFKKTARFPGFRVGTIPAFMMPKVKEFVILECLEKTLGDAVRDQEMELANADIKPTLDPEQVKKIVGSFKEGAPFTYTIEAQLKKKEGAADSATAIDVEVK